MTASAKTKGGNGTPTRVTTPVSNKAPRIMVTESNRSVEWHVEACGGMVIKAGYSPEAAIRDLALCDGLVITGGGDVNPKIYGQEAHPQVYGRSESRDLRELGLLGAARDLGIPVLGICRGLQVINVEGGGTLYQHIPDRVKHDNHNCSMMPVQTMRGSVVARTLGERPSMLHLHHQSVRRTAPGFQVTARHADGTVEAIESIDGRVIGVQFHPESCLSGDGGGPGWRLFDAFTDTCTRYRRRAVRNGRKGIKDPKNYLNRWPVALDAFDNRHTAYTGKAWAGSTQTSSGAKNSGGGSSSDKGGAGKALATVTTLPTKSTVVQTDERPVAFCPDCGIAFDFYRDYQDHCDWFHPTA